MNITYLIGAGASAEAIPPVGEEFNKRFIAFCRLLVHYSRRDYSKSDLYRKFIERAIEELPKHSSVDTYARKLFFKDENEYKAFKLLLSAYFLFQQMGDKVNELGIYEPGVQNSINEGFLDTRKKLDTRYDVLYAALLDEKTRELPSNIHFISWNYDVQFELSLMGFLNISIDQAFRDLKVYPSPSGRTENDLKKATFLKLNGTAGLVYQRTPNSTPSYVFDIKKVYGKSDIETHLNDISRIINNKSEKGFESMLHFAWENEVEVKEAREKAKEILLQTNILVIIGYSFPLYNRKVDKEIFEGFYKKNPKVYMQVLKEDFEAISERFKATGKNDTPIIPRLDLKQFFVPDELI